MNLVIRAHTKQDETCPQTIVGHFDERGGTIGRSDTNTLTLPDPKRHISRLQAEVVVPRRRLLHPQRRQRQRHRRQRPAGAAGRGHAR